MVKMISQATIDNVYACFILANGARMEGIESEIFFTFFGLEAITKKKLEKLLTFLPKHIINRKCHASDGTFFNLA